MMRRILFVAVVLAIFASAVPARAFTSTERFTGQFVKAEWVSAGTFVHVSYQVASDYLLVYVEEETSGGGYYFILADANLLPYGSFTIDRLNTAHMEATDIPASRCDYDANGDLIGCSSVSIDLDLTWSGYGRATIGTTTDRTVDPGEFVQTFHLTETRRAALASGTFNGTSLSTDDLLSASLSLVRMGTVVVCVPCG
jgi:hypothetical protein